MMLRSLRGLTIFGAVAVTFLATPPESKAIFHWFRNCFRPVTTYQPVVAAPACNPCAPQAVQYVPQTAYRQQIVNIPVTTMQQVVTTDPCTGCPVTTCRPVTSCVRQVRMVPYTTYRVVRRPVARVRTFFAPAPVPVRAPAAASCCGTATGTYGTYGTPATVGAPVSVSTPTYGVPSTPAPIYSSPGLSPTPAPSLPPDAAIPASPGSSAARTYQESSSPTRVESRSLLPLSQPQQQEPTRPDNQNDGNGPQLNAPTSGNMNQPIPHTWTHSQPTLPYTQVTWPPRAARHVASRQASNLNERPSPRQPTMDLDDSGWRASSR